MFFQISAGVVVCQKDQKEEGLKAEKPPESRGKRPIVSAHYHCDLPDDHNIYIRLVIEVLAHHYSFLRKLD